MKEYDYIAMAGLGSPTPDYRILVREKWQDDPWRMASAYGPIYEKRAAVNLVEMLNDKECN